MFIELLLVSSVGACFGGIAYLRHYSVQEKKADAKKRQEQEAQFRVSLLHELRKSRSTEFRLSSFAAKCELPKGVADRVADEIYSALYRRVIADGIVNEKERSELAQARPSNSTRTESALSKTVRGAEV